MAEFYVKKNKVSYKLSNGKELVESYENQKEKDLKSMLDKMEDTINFEKKFKPYDFSFIKLDGKKSKKEVKKDDVIEEIKNYLKGLNLGSKDKQITLGINNAGPYKDKWFKLDEDNKKGTIIDELKSKVFCARVDYTPSKNKACIQYMVDKNGKVIKSEFEVKNNTVDDDILKEYLK